MSLNQATQIDELRKRISPILDEHRKPELGQFMTPSSIAKFMASLFSIPKEQEIHLLDAGAGIGSLSIAFIEHHRRNGVLKRIRVSAYEIDHLLLNHLNKNFEYYNSVNEGCAVDCSAYSCDFIEHAIDCIQFKLASFTHAILNPPYKKINSKSRHRKLLRAVNIETVNLYTAFLALSILLIEDNGEIVAIIPRSFCNGPYYKPFRKLLLQLTSLDHIHIFESRKNLFKEDAVLQENVIIRLTKTKQKKKVKISHSSDSTLSDYKEDLVSFDRIVQDDDEEIFIHIPTQDDPRLKSMHNMSLLCLEELGISVSTGPVVDFRLKKHLLRRPEIDSIPLIYPTHYKNYKLTWPKLDGKKPNAIRNNQEVKKWLYPNAYYAVVKRFSSKEETKRIKSYIHDPNMLACDWVGFENHLNIFHRNKNGLDKDLALGLMAYLNSRFVDKLFRQFNGHTQVNATDLRIIKYPSLDTLYKMGKWVNSHSNLSDAAIDAYIEDLL